MLSLSLSAFFLNLEGFATFSFRYHFKKIKSTSIWQERIQLTPNPSNPSTGSCSSSQTNSYHSERSIPQREGLENFENFFKCFSLSVFSYKPSTLLEILGYHWSSSIARRQHGLLIGCRAS